MRFLNPAFIRTKGLVYQTGYERNRPYSIIGSVYPEETWCSRKRRFVRGKFFFLKTPETFISRESLCKCTYKETDRDPLQIVELYHVFQLQTQISWTFFVKFDHFISMTWKNSTQDVLWSDTGLVYCLAILWTLHLGRALLPFSRHLSALCELYLIWSFVGVTKCTVKKPCRKPICHLFIFIYI